MFDGRQMGQMTRVSMMSEHILMLSVEHILMFSVAHSLLRCQINIIIIIIIIWVYRRFSENITFG